ncbi:hypothetical protein BJ912DRAFT_1031235 [Pholiota molesta]|nr:hypothetical protein BJ912DRAFT_1031235 [Pholiota molesta]
MRSPAVAAIVSLILINLAFPLWRIFKLKERHLPSIDNQVYSYVGTDYPFYHPTLALKPARLNLQETLHYGYNSSDTSANDEWNKILDLPIGTGRTHLGDMRRSFLLTFYHQLHCIVELRAALVDRNDKWATPHHVNHCMQYLRQTLLCQANDMLEEGDFMERTFEIDRLGPELECYDWTSIYQEVGVRYNEFSEWVKGSDTMA